ncbi:MAG: hypothetical protein HC902_08695 [Calothrix sp. SM1_5_4]|nr:hypothetical protein [Calothrix sp. SM1_5_4]
MKALTVCIASTLMMVSTGFAHALPINGEPDAPEFKAPISQIVADATTLNLDIAGHLPSPCFTDPDATLIEDKENPGTLILKLSSPLPHSFCVAQVKFYQTLVSLPDLAKKVGLNVEDKAIYRIKTDGYDFELLVSGSDLNR